MVGRGVGVGKTRGGVGDVCHTVSIDGVSGWAEVNISSELTSIQPDRECWAVGERNAQISRPQLWSIHWALSRGLVEGWSGLGCQAVRSTSKESHGEGFLYVSQLPEI